MTIASSEYNYFVTSQEFTIFKFSFLIGCCWIIRMFIDRVISFPNQKFSVYGAIIMVIGIQSIALLMSLFSKFEWCWQLGIVFFLLYFANLFFVWSF